MSQDSYKLFNDIFSMFPSMTSMSRDTGICVTTIKAIRRGQNGISKVTLKRLQDWLASGKRPVPHPPCRKCGGDMSTYPHQSMYCSLACRPPKRLYNVMPREVRKSS